MARPSSATLADRERSFVRELTRTGSVVLSVRASQIDERHVVRLLDRPDVRPVVAALLAGRAA